MSLIQNFSFFCFIFYRNSNKHFITFFYFEIQIQVVVVIQAHRFKQMLRPPGELWEQLVVIYKKQQHHRLNVLKQ